MAGERDKGRGRGLRRHLGADFRPCPCQGIPMVSERKVRLVQGAGGSPNFCFGLEDVETGADVVFVQSDWDYPGLASRFGWSVQNVKHADHPRCEHDGTDGTVVCPDCGLKAGDFIASAFDWLADHDGAEIECSDYDAE